MSAEPLGQSWDRSRCRFRDSQDLPLFVSYSNSPSLPLRTLQRRSEPIQEEYIQLLEGMRPFLGLSHSDINTVLDPGLSRNETDCLFKTIEDYDSRFLVVHDRYEFPGGVPRSLEVRTTLRRSTVPLYSDLGKDLKERYYSICVIL